jgi:hypothetical protein
MRELTVRKYFILVKAAQTSGKPGFSRCPDGKSRPYDWLSGIDRFSLNTLKYRVNSSRQHN